ncbi:MAG: ABC transporter ATP-binding protein [Blautia sp.]
MTFLGPSGCGKTTTLRIIAGLETPDGGQVLLEGQDVTKLDPNRRDVNTVFQNYALFPHMNVADNVGYGLKIRKVPKEEIRRRVEEMLTLYSWKVLRSPLNCLGTKAEGSYSRAVSPKVLLLDEPLGRWIFSSQNHAIELKNCRSVWDYIYLYHP